MATISSQSSNFNGGEDELRITYGAPNNSYASPTTNVTSYFSPPPLRQSCQIQQKPRACSFQSSNVNGEEDELRTMYDAANSNYASPTTNITSYLSPPPLRQSCQIQQRGSLQPRARKEAVACLDVLSELNSGLSILGPKPEPTNTFNRWDSSGSDDFFLSAPSSAATDRRLGTGRGPMQLQLDNFDEDTNEHMPVRTIKLRMRSSSRSRSRLNALRPAAPPSIPDFHFFPINSIEDDDE